MLLDKRIPLTYLLKKVWKDVLIITLVGTALHYATFHFIDSLPELPLAIPTFLGTAMSVILGFKMSQSYDRWWEARKVWGALVNDSRSWVIQLQSFVSGEQRDLITRMSHRIIAFNYALGESLRGQDPIASITRYSGSEDGQKAQRHQNKPLSLLQMNAQELKRLREEGLIDTFSHVQMDSTLVRLCDSMGKAERINSTVFPVTYRIFLHFAIYLFVILLSVSLKEVSTLLEIPLLTLMALVFFMLEKTAYVLQDPFRNRPSDIPVTTISRTIEINVRQLLGETKVPEPIKSDTFSLL
jgi:putative membrane protein